MTTGRSILIAKLRKLAAQFPYLPQALRLVWSAAPRHAALWAALLVFQGLLPIVTVYLTRSLVNALVAAVRAPAPPSGGRSALLLMAAMAALLLVAEAARVFTRWVRTAQADRVQDHVNQLIHRKSMSVDLAFYDNAEFYDHLHRARSEAGYRPVDLLENLGGIVQNGTLGDLAMFYQAFQQGLRLSRSLLDDVGQLYANTLFLGNLFEFLALEPKVRNPALAAPFPPLRQAISFRGVSFRYPGASRLVLRDFDAEIPAGRITAVVGSNGAGKSTLLKLLCRFYDPDDGSIEIDGVDLRTADLDSLRASITLLFQQPVHYNATVAENIALGDISSPPDRAAIQTATEGAGAGEIVGSLPSGYDHLLGRGFENGTELSAGEWQRIALARAFLRQAPILVLDEPTSAMDPWAESDWFHHFRQLAAGRTTVVITHRFSTARIADIILVMSDGRVIERGSHDELISAGGRYAQGWIAQAHA